MTLEETVRSAFRTITDAELVAKLPTIVRAEWVVPLTREALEDAPRVRRIVAELFWRAELATAGFLGLVRCARCRRPTRCVYAVGDRLFGRTCARRAVG